jgi:hypothetical protein
MQSINQTQHMKPVIVGSGPQLCGWCENDNKPITAALVLIVALKDAKQRAHALQQTVVLAHWAVVAQQPNTATQACSPSVQALDNTNRSKHHSPMMGCPASLQQRQPNLATPMKPLLLVHLYNCVQQTRSCATPT